MEKIQIMGQQRLEGAVQIHGSKNSALPILAATILIQGTTVLHNCPRLSDVTAAVEILEALGCHVHREKHSIAVDAASVHTFEISDALMLKMRSSIIFLGAILGRMGQAVLSTPGGCEIGLRPIDLHLSALEQMGAKVQQTEGKLYVSAPKGLTGKKITLAFPSVGATENVLLAAVHAKGTTILSNAAREPEIMDLADFLNGAGAKIQGAGDSTIVIHGVPKLYATEHTVIPDRIEGASYLLAGAANQGNVEIQNCIPAHIGALYPILEEMGCRVNIQKSAVQLKAPPRLHCVKMTRTMPYPGFPTDMQALLSATLTIAKGTSVVLENIFESRYKHAAALFRMGAKIHVEGRMEVIEGVQSLTGSMVEAPDLRSGMALILAGLHAEGETLVGGLSHIDRGYEDPEKSLEALGANIKRIKDYARTKTNHEQKT